MRWLAAHRNKKNNLVVTLKRTKTIQRESGGVPNNDQDRLKSALEYDISLGHQVVKSKMKASAAQLGLKECLVLKLDLFSEFIKEYIYEEVHVSEAPSTDVRAAKFELDKPHEILFSVESDVFKYLKKSISGKTVLEFNRRGISFTEDQLFGANKLVLDGPNLADYDHQNVSALLGSDAIKISSNSLFDMISFGRQFNLDRVSILLGEKVASGWHFHVVLRVEFCSVWLKFIALDISNKPGLKNEESAINETRNRQSTQAQPESANEALDEPSPRVNRKGRLFAEGGRLKNQFPRVGHKKEESAHQMRIGGSPPTKNQSFAKQSRKLMEIQENGSWNSQLGERPMAKIYQSPENRNSKKQTQRLDKRV